ncbi:hypothetical protein CASFOL_042539 [Castilleja foliolosa]|uniref:Uncharacterized protein n=1 Tax=Castilleja foliolosa TaxID=1961234 RepID=A0ABD3B8M5_9LAMI
MTRKNVSNIVLLVLLALMPFTTLGISEIGTSTFVCRGPEMPKAEADCSRECKKFPFYGSHGDCQWGWMWFWPSRIKTGKCVCFVGN